MPKQFDSMSEMARVVVIGTSCVGKTTFAQALARVLNFPHVELDSLHWQPNWIPRPPEEFRALTAEALAKDCWITDGNYGAVRDLVWSRATTIIWLNYCLSSRAMACVSAYNPARTDARRTVLWQS